MTPAAFARIALSLEGTIEGAHGGHADFRAGGKVFATLGYPTKEWGMVKLAPEHQQAGRGGAHGVHADQGHLGLTRRHVGPPRRSRRPHVAQRAHHGLAERDRTQTEEG